MSRRQALRLFAAICLIAMSFAACGKAAQPAETATTPATAAITAAQTQPETTAETEGTNDMQELTLRIDGQALPVDWENNESVAALRQLASEGPLELTLSAYGGFEQVGPIGRALPRNDRQITTQAGDIMLYAGNQIVLFYGANSWRYTRLGRFAGLTQRELATLLGGDTVTLTLSLE